MTDPSQPPFSPSRGADTLRVARLALAHAAQVGRLALSSVYNDDIGRFDADQAGVDLGAWSDRVGLPAAWVRGGLHLALERGIPPAVVVAPHTQNPPLQALMAFNGNTDSVGSFLGALAAVTPRGERILPGQVAARLLASQGSGAEALTRRGDAAMAAFVDGVRAAARETGSAVDVEACRKRMDREVRALWMEEEVGHEVAQRLTPTQRARLSRLREPIRSEAIRRLKGHTGITWRSGTFRRIVAQAVGAVEGTREPGVVPPSSRQLGALARRVQRLQSELQATCEAMGMVAEVFVLPANVPPELSRGGKREESPPVAGLRLPSAKVLAALRASLRSADPQVLARAWRLALDRLRAWEPHLPPAVFAVLGGPLLAPV